MDKLHQAFDNQTLNYNISKYPQDQIILDCVRAYHPDVKSLDTIHETVNTRDLFELGHKVNRDLYKTEFYKNIDAIISEHIGSVHSTDVLVQRFPSLRFLPPNQDEEGAVLLFHQGRWVGNGFGMFTYWIPFTPCYESNTMQILDLDISRDITRKAVTEHWSYEKLNEVSIEHGWPITLQPGQAHLFFQEHIHGNIPNRTGKTRCSIDIRILVRDGQCNRKWPGSYFRPLGKDFQKTPEFKQGENIVTYAEYEGIKTKKLDLYFQTLVVKEYCRRAGINQPYQHGENEGLNYSHMEYLVEKSGTDHLLLTSIFSLPDDPAHRRIIMEKAVASGCKIHLCNEDMIVETAEDIENVEYIRTFTNDWSSPVDQLTEELDAH